MTSIHINDIPSQLSVILETLSRGDELLVLNNETPIGRLVPSQVTPQPTVDNKAFWQEQFDAWMKRVEARKDSYLPGFAMDDSRDAIYADRP